MSGECIYERPKLYPKQEAFLFTPARYSITEASTKSGKTVGCLVWLFEQAINPEVPQLGRNYWWVAPVYPVARIAFRRMKRFIPMGLYTANESELSITLRNGATLWFKGSDKPDTLYGEDVYGAVIDEATRCKEEAFHAVRSTLTATRGHIRIISNVKGRQNWAYNLARKAEQGAPDMAYFKLTAYDAVQAGVLSADEIEDAKRALPEQVFKELYLAEPSDDGGNPFGIAAIRACIKPLSTKPPAAWGIDLAKSVDWTWCIALDAEGVVCRSERWQAPWETTMTRVLALVEQAPALVDSTGVGDPIVEHLQKAHPHIEGFKFTSTSKQQIMEGLAVGIQQKTIGYPDGQLVNELESFEYEYSRTGVRYSAPEGLHDDGVCALALAVQKLRATPPVVNFSGGEVRQSYWKRGY